MIFLKKYILTILLLNIAALTVFSQEYKIANFKDNPEVKKILQTLDIVKQTTEDTQNSKEQNNNKKISPEQIIIDKARKLNFNQNIDLQQDLSLIKNRKEKILSYKLKLDKQKKYALINQKFFKNLDDKYTYWDWIGPENQYHYKFSLALLKDSKQNPYLVIFVVKLNDISKLTYTEIMLTQENNEIFCKSSMYSDDFNTSSKRKILTIQEE